MAKKVIGNKFGGYPFSEGVLVDGTFYLSGMLGIDFTKGILAEGGVKEETRCAISNLEASLKKADMTLANVVKITGYLADLNDYAEFNEAYSECFKNIEELPAREVVQVGLILGAKVELSFIAVK